MKAIRIDFAPSSPARITKHTSPLTWVLILTGLFFCGSATVLISEITQQRPALELQHQRIIGELAARSAQRPVLQNISITELQAKALNGAISQLNLPWGDLLNAMEAATPDSIALLSLEPDGKKHLLKGAAESKSAEDMLDYIRGLKEQPFFETVNLTKHAVNEQDPHKPLRFHFEARWKAGD